MFYVPFSSQGPIGAGLSIVTCASQTNTEVIGLLTHFATEDLIVNEKE